MFFTTMWTLTPVPLKYISLLNKHVHIQYSGLNIQSTVCLSISKDVITLPVSCMNYETLF